MRQQLATTVLAAIVAFPALAAAQIKTLPGEKITLTATVESIERASRLLTLKGADGKLTTITVPKDVTRFDALKVGDTLTATYYDNVVLRKKEPGEKDVNTLSGAAMKSDSTKPGGVLSFQPAATAREGAA